MSDDLEPISPADALDAYLAQRQAEVSDQTLQTHRYRLEQFVEWCDEQAITNLNDLSGRDIHAYRIERQAQDLKLVSIQGQISTVRVFLRFCASIDAVDSSLPSKIILPTVSLGEGVNEETIDASRAEHILEYLDRYSYASRDHVVMLLLWSTGMRMGAIRAIDLGDLDLEDESFKLVHRPDEDTPLKNGIRSERWVAISSDVARIIGDYIEGPRIETEDNYGRKPLLTTSQGRAHGTTIRAAVYSVTRPCEVGQPCPHDRDISTCEATNFDEASKCPSSKSPHKFRSGAITNHLLGDVPVDVVSDRMDVSERVLDRHYDRRTQREKMKQRREHLFD